VIGIAALLTPWKGHEVVLDAFAQLESTDVVLEIMGGVPANDERYAQALQLRSARLGIADRVRFLGHRDDPLDTMRRWSIAISASTDPEAGPLVGLEAMSLGLPVIATDHGGVTEVLGSAGVLVPPGDAVALARTIDALLADEDARQRHGAAGPDIVRSRGFTLEAQSAHWLAVLESVAGGNAQG
jgi:glycosyltransferase involved in cell wall biosynthesis